MFLIPLDLVWSDPEDIESGLWAISPRGAGYLFGSKIVSEVLERFFVSQILIIYFSLIT